MNSQTALTGLIGPVGPDGRGTGESGTDAFAGLFPSAGSSAGSGVPPDDPVCSIIAQKTPLLLNTCVWQEIFRHFIRCAGKVAAKERTSARTVPPGKTLSLPRVCACARVSPAPA